MSTPRKIFHESWYRIASARICLRPSVRVSRRTFRGKRWHVLHDPFSDKFFRLRPEAYEFVARLSAKKTVEEAWNDVLNHVPETAPGQGAVIELLAQLHQANFLQGDLPPDSAALFERQKKQRQKLLRMSFLNIMFARIPLWDPHAFLTFLTPLITVLISPIGLFLWIAVMGIGAKTALVNIGPLWQQVDGILALSNLPLLYAGLALVKLCHEFGHAFAVRRFGGEVHVMGIMLLVLTPLPYTDATASWAFRSKWQRLFVAGAGMIVELFIAAIAVVVWAGTGDGLLHSLAYNIIFTASVSTLLFNINPLLRFDGYYMLSDLLDIPNLHKQGTGQLRYLLERHGFGRRDARRVAESTPEAILLSVFSLASFFYRIIVFGGIMLFIATKFLFLAIVMGASLVITWGLLPLFKFVKYLTTDPSLTRVRSRALFVCGGTVFSLLLFLATAPFPFGFTAAGVLRADGYRQVSNPTPGLMSALVRTPGATVRRGDTLVLLENVELRLRKKETEASLEETRYLYQRALDSAQADLDPIRRRMAAFRKRLDKIDADLDRLAVRAEIGGIWHAPGADDRLGSDLPRGTVLGMIIDSSQFHFVSVVPQQEIGELFAYTAYGAAVRIAGRAGCELSADTLTVIPLDQRRLPSPALGMFGGGGIAIEPGDSAGTRATEPFYEVRARIGGAPDVRLLHGRSGTMRFRLGERPLLFQGWRKLRQVVQKFYRI